MKKNRIVIISIYSFPFGGAATNRILAYSKGLVSAGIDVDVFVPIPTDNNYNTTIGLKSGVFDGINYFYTSGRIRSRFKLLRGIAIISRYRKIKGYISIFCKILREKKRTNFQSIIISTDEIFTLFIYIMLAKVFNSKAIFIFDEFPIPIRHKLKNHIPFLKTTGYRFVLKFTDAYISISEKLSGFFNDLRKKNTFIMSIIVDTSKFSNLEPFENHKNNEYKYLTYMGNMELSKDNVDLIIIAFSKIEKKYNNIRLNLYGSAKKNDNYRINSLIEDLGLRNKIILKGRIDSSLVPSVLSSSYILVSSQPDTLRASGGFPTKLGEYLASGVPTLITDVGENSKFVEDGVHCFFAPPNNADEYASKLKFIIDNYDTALRVASNGKKLIFENYSYTVVGRDLAVFLSKL